MDKITIQNLEIFAKHGVFPAENELGQKFILSAVLYTDVRKAGKTDSLEYSTHYGEVCHMMKEFVEEHTFQLIETVVERLAEKILRTFPRVEKVDLEIKKPWAPIGLPLDTVTIKISRCWHRAFVALGSNMGDTKGHLNRAVRLLKEDAQCQVIKVADYLVTKPYGGVEQDDFLNSVLELRTLYSPEELLEVLHAIEQAEHRERLIHWGPRTLDLDILFYDDLVIDTETLHIPHIDLQNRDFVLIPMNQIAPYLRHPILQKTMEQLLKELQRKDP